MSPSFILRNIDPEFWARVQTKARAEGVSVKDVIIRLLTEWLAKSAPLLVLALFSTACAGGSVLAPTQPPPVVLSTLPLVLSGQSNALPDHLGNPLAAIYQPGVAVIAKGSSSIQAWQPTGELWPALEASLHHPLRAFIWWQGESDAMEGNDHYGADLRSLVARVRAANGNPRLAVIIVKSLPYAWPSTNTSAVRAAQEAYVASDPLSAIVRVDDLPTDGGNHSTAYPEVAARIMAVLP